MLVSDSDMSLLDVEHAQDNDSDTSAGIRARNKGLRIIERQAVARGSGIRCGLWRKRSNSRHHRLTYPLAAGGPQYAN